MNQTSLSARRGPITEDWKISQVIQVHPELLETLIEAAPVFRKLRNPLLRRVQTKLVTVGEAARIAEIEPATLVDLLNAAAGFATTPRAPRPSTTAAPSTLEPPWVGSATIASELDVRPFQRRDEEPFSAIMAAIRDVPRGQVLVLRNTFEPVPLYAVLGQRGFEHWTHQLAYDDWEIRFFNAGTPHLAPPPVADPGEPIQPATWDEPTATLTIDVSELVPPEPMIRILSALEELPDGASLLVHHVRRPMHLYPRLDELGYRHETRELAPGRIEVLIEKTPGSTDSQS